jgi:hypothetical protein
MATDTRDDRTAVLRALKYELEEIVQNVQRLDSRDDIKLLMLAAQVRAGWEALEKVRDGQSLADAVAAICQPVLAAPGEAVERELERLKLHVISDVTDESDDPVRFEFTHGRDLEDFFNIARRRYDVQPDPQDDGTTFDVFVPIADLPGLAATLAEVERSPTGDIVARTDSPVTAATT